MTGFCNCRLNVEGVSTAKYKSQFTTEEAALAWIKECETENPDWAKQSVYPCPTAAGIWHTTTQAQCEVQRLAGYGDVGRLDKF
jgi:viroplasmin and RNaseH domain-containing protein